LKAYLDKAANASFIPKDEKDLRLLLRSFLILKALYELRYELNNRPKWVAIPLRGLLGLIDKGVVPEPKQ
jgi:maltose alpha-D-glucosyltransferase/alpha-amylase